MNLPIDIGLGHVVHINQGDAPNPRAGQGFCGPRTDTSNADYTNMRSAQSAAPIHTIQAIRPTKTARQIRGGFIQTYGGPSDEIEMEPGYCNLDSLSRATLAASVRSYCSTRSSNVLRAACGSLSSL